MEAAAPNRSLKLSIARGLALLYNDSMPKRRSRGEGSIIPRKDGLWTGEITLPDGKRKTKYAKSQKEDRDWLQERAGRSGRNPGLQEIGC